MSYSLFFSAGLQATAASIYSYSHPAHEHDHDNEFDPKAPQSPTLADRVYFADASRYRSNSTSSQTLGQNKPERKRRSSITAAASPVSAVKLAKSPARAAGNAWHAHVAASPSRSRSGSMNIASDDTSMLGRMRSGSIGTTRLPPRAKKPMTSKRPVALLFAPTPAPTTPLPALPFSTPHSQSSLALLQLSLPPAGDVFYSSSAGKPLASPVPSSPGIYNAVWPGFDAIQEDPGTQD